MRTLRSTLGTHSHSSLAPLGLASAFALLPTLLLACSSSPPSEGAKAGAAGIATTSTNACSIDDSQWPANATPEQLTCGGQWTYEDFNLPCNQSAPNSACGQAKDGSGNPVFNDYPDSCNDFAACDYLSGGAFNSTQTFTEITTVYWIKTCDDGVPPSKCNSWEINTTVDGPRCETSADAWIGRLYPADIKSSPKYLGQPTYRGATTRTGTTYGARSGSKSVNTTTCSVAIDNQWSWGTSGAQTNLRWPSGGGVARSGSDGRAVAASEWMCPIAKSYTCADPYSPVWNACRAPGNGAEPDPGVCGAGATKTSATGDTLAQVEQNDPSAGLRSGKTGVYVSDTQPGFSASCNTGENLIVPARGYDGNEDYVPLPPSEQPRETAAQAKWSFLATSLASAPATPDGATLATMIVQKMKLLFELHGDALTAAQQADAVQLYIGPHASVVPSCGDAFTPPSIPQCTADPNVVSAINGALTFCARMALPHVAGAIRDIDAVQTTCLDVASKIATLRPAWIAAGGHDDGSSGTGDATDVCGFRTYRGVYDQLASQPLFQRLQQPKDATDATSEAVFRVRMARLGEWYGAIASLYPRDVLDARWAKVDTATGAFWRGVHRSIYVKDGLALPTLGGSGDAGADAGPPPVISPEIVAQITQDSLVADRNLLTWVFTDPSSGASTATTPLTSAPVLTIAADAFQAFEQRLEDMAVYHDMGCIYQGCLTVDPTTSQSVGVESEMTRLWRLLASVANKGSLATEVTNAAALVRPEWLGIFSAIAAHHDRIESAMAEATGAASYTPDVEAELENGSLNGPPMPAVHLASLVQTARNHVASYAKSGLLNPTARNRLPIGIQQDKVASLRNAISTENDALKTAIGSYGTSLQTLASSAVQAIALQDHEQEIVGQLQAKMLDWHDHESDLEGLKASLEQQNDALSKETVAYEALKTIDGNAIVAQTTLDTITGLTAKAAVVAPGPLTTYGNVDQIATKRYLGIPAGTILDVHTTGTWSPTCALRTAVKGFVQPPGDPSYNIDPGARTGPEGYVLSQTNGMYTAAQNLAGQEGRTTNSDTTDTKVCGGFKTSVGISGNIGVFDYSAEAWFEVSGCEDWASSTSDSQITSSTSTTGGESRMSASFASGFHLQNSPVPFAPAGSLLLVATKKGDPTKVLDLRVVQAPDTTITLGDDADVYLVTNDITGCSDEDDSNGLNVTVMAGMHSAQAVASVGPAIAKVLQDIGAQAAGFVAQGRILPDQASALRTSALSDITTSCNCDMSKYPDPVNRFLLAWIDKHIARIETEVEIQSVEREIAALELQIRDLTQSVQLTDAQGRIEDLVPSWTLRSLDTNVLRAQVTQLTNQVTYDLYPILQLRYRNIFADLAANGQLTAALDTLVNKPWDADITELAQAVANADSAILATASNLDTGAYQELQVRDIVVQIPRTGLGTPDFSVIDDGRSSEMWKAIASADPAVNHHASFQLHPEDIYATGGPSLIHCNEEVPVIRDMAVVFSNSLSDDSTTKALNEQLWSLSGTAMDQMIFPAAPIFDLNHTLYSPGGALQFQLANADWQSLDMPVFFTIAPVESAVTFDNLRPNNGPFSTARGLSPFDGITLDFSPFYNGKFALPDGSSPLDAQQQLQIVMRLEMRLVSQPLSWITPCANAN